MNYMNIWFAETFGPFVFFYTDVIQMSCCIIIIISISISISLI